MFLNCLKSVLVHVGVDMFPPTDSAKNDMDMFPRTDSFKDIHSILSSHVDCVSKLGLKK
jgi:hypothetical protein